MNIEASYHVLNKVTRGMNNLGKCLKDAKIFVLGVTYKKDISDVRESPALKVIDLLIKEGAEVCYHDHRM